jgi:hypothetical protein
MKKSVIQNGMRYWLGIDGKPDIETISYGLSILVKRKRKRRVYAIALESMSALIK